MNKTEILTQIRSLIENRVDLFYHRELLVQLKAAGGNRFDILSLLYEVYDNDILDENEEILNYVLEMQGDLFEPHIHKYVWDNFYWGPDNYRKGTSPHPDSSEPISREEYDKIFIARGWVKEDGEFFIPDEDT